MTTIVEIKQEWHQKELNIVAQQLSTSFNGLESKEAEKRLVIHGPNQLFGDSGPSALKILLTNLFNFMNFILTVALIVSGVVIQDWPEVGILAFVVISNTGVGFYQEFKSEKLMDALKKLSSPIAKVKRNNQIDIVACETVVPGDVVYLEEGSIVPADIYIYEAINLQIDEAILTGEAVPVSKKVGSVDSSSCPLGDRHNMAFKNTLVSRGRGIGFVVLTGPKTEIGKIAVLVTSSSKKRSLQSHHVLDEKNQETLKNPSKCSQFVAGIMDIFGSGDPKTPLFQSLDRLMMFLALFAIVMAIVVFGSNKFEFQSYVVLYAVGVAVAILPEGLPAVITVTMALGVRRMANAKAIVRKLAALEALGQVTNICSDKTGTLTEGKMVAKMIWISETTFKVTGSGIRPEGQVFLVKEEESLFNVDLLNSESKKLALIACCLCVTSELIFDEKEQKWISTGDPTEVALDVVARKFKISKDSCLKSNYIFKAEMPFDSIIKRMTVVYEYQSILYAFTKGASESVLSKCSKYIDEKEDLHDLSLEFTNKIEENMLKFSSMGMRVIALAYKTISTHQQDSLENRDELEDDLIFLGLVAIYDPPRETSAESVRMCHEAGMNVHMATGDHPSTAVSIAFEIGILPKSLGLSVSEIMKRKDLVITAADFEKLSDAEIDALDNLPRVLARCSPESKVKLIDALHRRGKLVAMTGDGVNDAPAVKRADIGIAMGLAGSDVTKNASDITLTDDNFVTILKAVEEGRVIFKNIQKFTLHLLCGNVSEVIVLVIGLALRDSEGKAILPMSSIQILWLNMITSTPIALSLGMELGDSDTMKVPPRSKKTTLFTVEMVTDTLYYGTVMGTLSLVSFILTCIIGESLWSDTAHCYLSPAELSKENITVGSECDVIYQARTVAFYSLSFMLLIHGFNCRNFRLSVFQMKWRGEKKVIWLILSILLGLVLVIPTAYIPGLKEVCIQAGITWEWWLVITSTLLFQILAEVYKLLKRYNGWYLPPSKVIKTE